MKKIGRVFILSAALFAGSAVTSNTPFSFKTAEASRTMAKSYAQTTAILQLRTGAGSKFKALIAIPKGKNVTILGKSGSWYKIAYTYKNGSRTYTKSGWVSGAFLNQYSALSKKYYFTKSTAGLYSTPNTQTKAALTVSASNGFYTTTKILTGNGQTWFLVAFNGKSYYINSKDVMEKSFASIKNEKFVSKQDTYLYASYGSAYKKLIKIPKDSVIATNSKIGDWYSVSFNKMSGYIFIGDFMKAEEIAYELTEPTFYITNKSTKLFELPSAVGKETFTAGNQTGFLSDQKAINNGEIWLRVSFQDKQYFIKKTDVNMVSSTEVQSIELKAPNQVNIYQSIGKIHKVVDVLPKDVTITSFLKIGDWYSVSYNGKNGFVDSSDFSPEISYTEDKITDTIFLTADETPIRATADLSSPSISTVPASKLVVATHKTSNGWYKISFNGTNGYLPGASLKQVKTGAPLSGAREGYQFIDLRTPSLVTAKQIDDYIALNVTLKGKPSVLIGKGQVFLDTGKKYGVNALYLAAHAIHESDFGVSNISQEKYNLFGFGAVDSAEFVGAYRFLNVEQCIEYVAQYVKSTYINPNLKSTNYRYQGTHLGFSTIDSLTNKRIDLNSEGMNFFYATDSLWGKSIANHMEKILPFNKAYYGQVKPNETVPVAPQVPEGKEVFPAGVLAIANSDIVLQSSKGGRDNVKTLPKGSTFNLLEKHNDSWVKIIVNNSVYWAGFKSFSKYSNILSVKNLGRAKTQDGITPAFRSEPTTANNTNMLNRLKVNEYVTILLQDDGSLFMDATKKWYKVQRADGSVGWVHSTLITKELS